MNKSLLLLFFLFGCAAVSYGQTKKTVPDYTYTFSGNFHRGFVLKHTFKIGHLSQGYTNGFELGITRNTYGAKPFEQVYNYPDIGVAVSYFDYASDWLGKSVGLIAFSDFYLVRARTWGVLARIGTGLGYHTNPYDKETNNKNVAVGSPVTFAMQARLGVNISLTDRLTLNNYLTMTHFSAAAFDQPNMGINNVSANFGLSYRLTPEKPDYKKDKESFTYSRKIYSNLRLGYALKEAWVIGGPKFPVYTFSYYLDKQISHTNIINIGFDVFANTAVKEEMKWNSTVNQDNPPDYKRMGVAVGHELVFDRFGVFTQFGIYVYRPFKIDKPFYQRYGLKYQLGGKLFTMLSFVSHYINADHAELSMGIRF